jgi:hypothetical protein
VNTESIQTASVRLDEQAQELYRNYGARPWPLLPEATREHFRALVRAGVDGEGHRLTGRSASVDRRATAPRGR